MTGGRAIERSTLCVTGDTLRFICVFTHGPAAQAQSECDITHVTQSGIC